MCRGEPFFQGRPASYYAACARKAVRLGAPSNMRPFTPAELWVRDNLSQTLADLVWGGQMPFYEWCGWPRLRGDWQCPGPAAVPVLMVLAGDADAGVRWYATSALYFAARDDPALAVPGLMQLLDDDEPWVRYEATVGLGKCGPAARVAIPKLRALVNDSASPAKGTVVGVAVSEVLEQLEQSARSEP